MFETIAPDIMGDAVVVCYTVINLVPLKDGEQKLACFATVCQYKPGDGYYLFYCDDNWNVFADTWHESIEDAKDQANYDYAIVNNRWNYK